MSRAVPPPEHLDYLQQIGVDIHSTTLAASRPAAPVSPAPSPAPVAVAAPAARPAAPPRPAVVVATPAPVRPVRRPEAKRPRPRYLPMSWRFVDWAIGILVAAAVLILLFFLLRAHGVLAQEPSTATSASPTAIPASEKAAVRPQEQQPSSPHSTRAATPGFETVVGIAFLSGLGYLTWDRRKLGSRLGRIEAALRLEQQPPSPETTPAQEETPPVHHATLPALLNAQSPEAALGSLIAEAKRRSVATLPRAATRRWGAGVASITGPVRKENQDAAIVFEVEATTVLIVADGLGGLPHGQEAARLAVGAAALSAAEVLGGSPGPTAHPELVAEQALLESAAALCRQARSSGWTETRDGFRSTLICVVATPTTYGFCYLGDGGGIVVRQTGAIDAFLVPQKADGIANVVAGSLGPVIHGTPVVGKLPRQGGDNLFIGTDGVFDRVPDGFAASVVRLLGSHDGDAQAVASLVVSDFASAKDGSLFVCDDNMSIAILCTPAPRPATAAATIQRPHAVRR